MTLLFQFILLFMCRVHPVVSRNRCHGEDPLGLMSFSHAKHRTVHNAHPVQFDHLSFFNKVSCFNGKS